jgi:hypothetical protein
VRRPLVWAALPLLLVAAVAAILLLTDPLRGFGPGAPPIERLSVERTVLDGNGIALILRAGGSEPVEIAQVQVDGAYWSYTLDPPGPIGHLATATLRLPYPWVQGETHSIVMLTRTGLAFEHVIEVAVPTPTTGGATLQRLGLIGLTVGLLPVALGMLFYPALRAGGPALVTFALALTVGLLAFLLVDTLGEALELAGEAAADLKAPALVWLIAGSSTAALFAVTRTRQRRPEGMALATSIALGIGLHNLGEGLAIGAAFATGATALGSYLVLGFTLHNVTEGVGIVAPLLREPPRLGRLAALAALAGLPAVLGIWLGAYAFTPFWAAMALAVGAGAILQVVIEVGLLLGRQAGTSGRGWASAPAMAGAVLGLAVMYATALLIPA